MHFLQLPPPIVLAHLHFTLFFPVWQLHPKSCLSGECKNWFEFSLEKANIGTLNAWRSVIDLCPEGIFALIRPINICHYFALKNSQNIIDILRYYLPMPPAGNSPCISVGHPDGLSGKCLLASFTLVGFPFSLMNSGHMISHLIYVTKFFVTSKTFTSFSFMYFFHVLSQNFFLIIGFFTRTCSFSLLLS